jgi:retinol dehydrogenase 12
MEKLLAMTTEEGGRQLVWAAVGGSGSTREEEKLKGGYVSFGEVVEPSDYSMSEEGLKVEEKYWVSTMNDESISQLLMLVFLERINNWRF